LKKKEKNRVGGGGLEWQLKTLLAILDLTVLCDL
jgi:hypothetical protein